MKRMLAVTTAAIALALAGCGGDDDDESASAPATDTGPAAEQAPTATEEQGGGAGGGGGATSLDIAADAGGQLRFDKERLTAEAGEITIVMENPSDLPHAVRIVDGGPEAEGEVVQMGETSEATATLEPGTYEYNCPVPGHTEAGMVGELVVR
jgi:plastocyanin